MNLQDSLKWLIVVSAGLVLSCKAKYNIGIPKEPQDNIGAFFHDTLTLETSVVWNDSISTTFNRTRSPYLMTGYYEDRYFGRLNATSFVSIFPYPGSNFTTQPTLDSVVLAISPFTSQDTVAYRFINQPFKVYEIEDGYTWPMADKYYVFSQAISRKTIDLKTEDFKFLYNSQTKLKQFRAKLSMAYGNKLLSQMQLSIPDFLNVNPGIVFESGGESNSKIFTLRNREDSLNSITLYFKDVNGRKGSQMFLFGADSSTFYKMDHDWSGTNLASLNEGNREISTQLTNNLCYVQSGIGLYTKIKIPYLNKIAGGRNVLVNKAEIVVTCPDGNEFTKVTRPFLSVYETNESNLIAFSKVLALQIVPSGNGTTSTLYYADYNSQIRGYKLDVTSYIQRALYNPTAKASLMLGAYMPTLSFVVDRAVFYDNKLSPTLGNNNRMKLNLYYTVVDK